MTIRVKELAAALALILTCVIPGVQAQGNIDFSKLEIQTVKISDGLYVLMGGAAQGNILVLTGSDGLFLVDSMYGQMHQKLLGALRTISHQPIRFLVNTHFHGDHTP